MIESYFIAFSIQIQGGIREETPEFRNSGLSRISDAGLKVEVHEIVVGGWRWNTTVCIRITDRATGLEGDVVYENRAVIFGKVRWGKIVFYEVYEDTEKVAALDEYLARHEMSSGASKSAQCAVSKGSR